MELIFNINHLRRPRVRPEGGSSFLLRNAHHEPYDQKDDPEEEDKEKQP